MTRQSRSGNPKDVVITGPAIFGEAVQVEGQGEVADPVNPAKMPVEMAFLRP